MTAILAYVQSNSVHVLTDGLLYGDGGQSDVVQTNFNKCVPVEGMRAVIAATGPAGFSYLVAGISSKYGNFDDLVKTSGDYLTGIFAFHCRRNNYKASATNLVLAGWLERENRPAAFTIDLIFGDIEEVRREILVGKPNCELTELATITHPPPNIETVKSSGWPLGIERDARNVETDLLHLMEIQRREKSLLGSYIVGGEVRLTTVTESGVTQRVVHTWSEDRAGQPINPEPIDWPTWRLERHGVKPFSLTGQRDQKHLLPGFVKQLTFHSTSEFHRGGKSP